MNYCIQNYSIPKRKLFAKYTAKIGLIIMLFMSNLFFGQTTTYFTYNNTTPSIPTGFVLTNNVAAQAIDQGTYLLVDAATTSDFIVTPNYDLSTYATATITVNVGTYGTGTANPLKIEFSTNGGTSWNATSYTSATPSSATYIAGGPIIINQTFSTTTKFRFSNKGSAGRGVRIQNLALIGSAPTAISSTSTGGNWSASSSWVGGVVPGASSNVIIVSGATITLDNISFSTRNSGITTTVNTGGTLATNVTYTNNGTTTINGTFQINTGGGITGASGTFAYGASGTLNFNYSTSFPVNASDVFWPTTNGPVNVSVLQGGLTLNSGADRTVSGIFQTAASVTQNSVLTLTGTCQLNSGGFFNSAPTYGANSTLIYNTSASISNEWTGNGAAGIGIPANIVVQNNGTLTISSADRGVPKNISIANGSNINLNNNSGNLYLGGNWSNLGIFTPNGRTVLFNGTATQTITGVTTFDNLTLNNAAGLVLNNNVIVNQTIALTSGKLTIGTSNLTIGNTGTITGANSTNYIVTTSTGQLKRTVADVNTLFPIGNTAYNPIIFNNSGTSDVYGVRVANGAITTGASNTKTINRSWVTTEAVAGGSNLSVIAQYNTGEPNTAFATATNNFIGLYNSSVWTQVEATNTGTNPYIVSSNTNIAPNDLTTGLQYFAIGRDNGFRSDATNLVVSSITPASPTAGNGFSVTLQSQDAYGDPVNVVSSTAFSLTTNGNAGTINGNTTGTIVAGSNSITVSGVKLASAGVGATLTASSASGDNLNAGTSAPFNVLYAATQLSFVGVPSSGNVGINLASFTIVARRPDNSLDTSYSGNVTITKSSGSGILMGTLTTTANQGIATFSNIQFSTASTYTLVATASGLSDATSNDIIVNLIPEMIYKHDFAATTTTPYTAIPTTLNTNLSASSWSNKNGLGTFSAANGIGNTSGSLSVTTINNTPYTLTFNVANGYSLSVTSFNLWRFSSQASNSISSITINGINIITGSISIPTGTNANSGTTLGQTNVASTISGLTGTITVEINLTNGGNGGSFRLDDFTLYGNVTCVQPAVYSVTGGGNGCATTGVPVGLSDSQIGVNYQLKNGSINIGTPIAGIGSAISFSNVTTDGNYTVVATNTNGTCNFTVNMTGSASVTTDPISAAGPVSTNQYICSGTQPTDISLATFTGNIQWQSSSNNVTFTNISGQTDATLSGSSIGILTSNKYYRAVVTSSNCSSAISDVVTVAISASPTILLGNIDATSPTATNFSIPFSVLTGNNLHYSINTVTPNPLPSFSSVNDEILGATPINVVIPQTLEGAYSFELSISDGTTGCTTKYPFQLNIVALNPGTIGTNQSVCINQLPNTIINNSSATGSGNITYTWMKSTTSIDSGYNIISNASSDSYAPEPLTQTTYFKRVANNGLETYESNPITISLNTLGTIGAINGINTVNGENTTTYSINPVTNASCYTWSLPAGMSIMSSNGNEIVVNIANSFIDGPISVKATNACSETETTSINVGKTLSSDSITISGPTNVCSLSNATYSVEAISGATYFWTLPTGMTLNSQANANTINVSFDPTFNMGGMSVIVTTSSNSVTPSLTIGRLDILGTISGPTNLCGLTSATYTIPTISGANAYNWTVPAGMTIVSGSTTNTITVNITGNVSGSIVLQASGTCGLSPFRTLKVDTNQRPLDISGPTSICGATTTTICNGGLSSSSIPTNEAVYTVPAIIGATSYTWSTPTGTTIQSGQGTNSIKVLYDLTSFSSGLITVASNTNCGTSALRTIEIGTARTIITGPTSLCDLTTATYAIPSTIGTNFMWTLPSCMTLLSGQSLTNNSITVAISGPICSTQTLSVAITGSCGPTNNITLQVSCSKYSKIQNSQNGVVVSSNIPVYADAITGGLGYRFKVYNTDGFVATIDKPSRYFYFNEIAGISYGKTYAVEVAVQTATSTYSDYGYGCPTTVILNGTKIQSSQCGTIMANNLPIYADNVVGAIGYKFEISDAITGSIIATINKTTRYFYFNEITGLSFGNTYNIRVAVKNPNGTYSPFGSSCAVTLQNTKIQSSICGTTVASNTPIYVDTVVGATGYKFEISNNVGTVIATLNKTSNFFYFSEIANSSFGATYQVRVAVKNVDNTTYGTFGASCLISLQTTKIQAIQCGTTVASTTPIYVDSVVGATGYKFEISNNAGTVIATVNKTSNFFNFNEIANTSFGATYQVRVAPKNSDNATYGAFGSSCQVSLQTTQIQAIQCGTTVVNTSLVYADALSGATGYKFEISNNLGTVIATLNKTTRFFTFTEITNATINTTYYIRVAPKNPDNTTFGTYGSSCVVTSQIQNTKVQASQCGTIIANNLPISADAVTAAVGYRFEISNNSGSVIATLDKSNRYFYFNEIANLSFGETYTVKVAPKNPDGISFGLFGASCNVTLQTSKIEAAICGTSMASNLPVYAENIASATGYRFEISNNSGAVIATLDKSTRYFYFNEISGVAFGTNYSIRVAPKNNNGLTYGLYGTACSVSLQGTKIQDSQCGSASAINLPIYADNVVGATGYRFEISNSTGNVITTLDKTNRYFYLNEISGVTFGTDYYVRVAVKKPTANTYSSFGTNCIISTLKTKIQSGQCGTTLPTNLPVYADAVTGASGYKFEISNASGTVITTINKTTRYFYFNEIPGVLNGTTYTVRVALKNPDNSSYSSYGISCNVTIGNTSAKTEIIEVTNKYEFAALAYPNPFEDNFKLLIKTANEKDDLHIKIYDMLGKQIGNEIVTPTEIEFYEFGKELASGVYNINISQGESNKTLRIIKR